MGARVLIYVLRTDWLSWVRATKLALVLTVLGALVPIDQGALPGAGQLIGSGTVLAQDQPQNLLQLLFKRKDGSPRNKVAPKKKTVRKKATTTKRVTRKKSSGTRTVRKRSSELTTLAVAPERVEKAENARRILVAGDFIADGMSQGLIEAYDQVPNVVVDVRTNGSSGLVRDDFYNWPEKIVPIIEELKPTLVVAMLGSNDRQAMRVNGRTEQVRSEAWETEYIRRVEAFAKAVRSTNTQLIWVGSPPFRFRSMSADILAFNEYYKAAAESTDGYFVDIWDGFVDEEGNFVSTGSDINGQPVRLRSSDGINFTAAGKRKLAFYVERQIKQLLGDAASPLLTSLANENVPLLQLPPLQTEAELESTNPMSIEDPELDGGNILLGDITQQASTQPSNPLQRKSVRQRLVEEGLPPPSQPDRADNFTWQDTL